LDEDRWNALNRKLDLMSRLLALNLLQGKNLTQQIMTLSSIGLEPKEIAQLLGKDPHVVSQTLYRTKKAVRPKTKKGHVERSE
jgi:DNA-directed RNA polymerase specialized sigma24 family protein